MAESRFLPVSPAVLAAPVVAAYLGSLVAESPDWLEVRRVRVAVLAGAGDWPAWVARWARGEFRGWSRGDLAVAAPAFLAVRDLVDCLEFRILAGAAAESEFVAKLGAARGAVAARVGLLAASRG